MALETALHDLLAHYPAARREQRFGKDAAMWREVEALAAQVAELEPVAQRPELTVDWSVGRGSWAKIPWLAIFDRRLTPSARQSLSCMLLCREDMSALALALTLGSGALYDIHGRQTGRRILRTQVTELRELFAELGERGFRLDDDLDLRAEGLGRDYEESAVAWRLYDLEHLPSAEDLSRDLDHLLQAYERYVMAHRPVVPAELIERASLEAAVAHFVELGREDFLERYGLPPAKRLHLVHQGRNYPARALFAYAWGEAFAEQGRLRSEQLEEGEALADQLVELGFEIVWGDDDRAWWRGAVGDLECSHDEGRRELGEALALLVVLGRARQGDATGELRASDHEELARLLRRFGEAERSAGGVIEALGGYRFFEVSGAGEGRVPPERWPRLRDDADFVDEMASRLLKWFFAPKLHASLRSLVGLDAQLRAEALAVALEDFAAALEASGMTFGGRHLEVAHAFVASLATKRFVILTGLSGSGKTQVALKFGEWLGDGRYMVVPVRPDWTGAEALFGFEDALAAEREGRRGWSVPDALAFILRAAADREHPYLLILDEMNLAHVERYFADVLSGMESGFETLPNLALEDDGVWRLVPDAPARLPVPDNLCIVGTVNVDETTYMFSPKVLDRANTLEFRVETRDLALHYRKPTRAQEAPAELARSFLDVARDDDWHLAKLPAWIDDYTAALRLLHEVLSATGFEFGHRVFYEAVRFAAMYEACSVSGEVSMEQALDLQVMQKVLPRLYGARRRLEGTLSEVARFCYELEASAEAVWRDDPAARFDPLRLDAEQAVCPLSFAKLKRMTFRLRVNQFTSFTE